MITPEGTGSESARPRKIRVALIGMGALVVIIGLLIIGTLTSPDPEATAVSSTTTTVGEVEPPFDEEGFDVSQIATGEPLDWDMSLAIDDHNPSALLHHDGALYLFATAGLDRDPTGNGLLAWRSADGASWELLGEAIGREHEISGVWATDQGLIALEPDATGNAFTLWRATDGMDWTAREVAVDHPDGPGFYPRTAGGTRETLVISGDPASFFHRMILARLEERYPDLDPRTYYWTRDTSAETTRFTLRSFAGLTLGEVTAEELGFSAEKRREFDRLYGRQQPTVGGDLWIGTDAGWQKSEITDAQVIFSITATSAGEIVATGFGRSGAASWSTRDGFDWEEVTSSNAPGPLAGLDRWRDSLVGAANEEAAIVAQRGDGTWEHIGPSHHFPTHITWSVRALGAGSGGIAAAIGGFDRTRPEDLAQAPSVAADGARLILDYPAGQYVLETGDSRHDWSMMQEIPKGIQPHPDSGTVSFHDPETGETLASFDIDAIHEAYVSYQAETARGSVLRAFAFTPDGSEWEIHDLSAIGSETRIASLEVTESHVVAVRIEAGGASVPQMTPGFEVWSAEIP